MKHFHRTLSSFNLDSMTSSCEISCNDCMKTPDIHFGSILRENSVLFCNSEATCSKKKNILNWMHLKAFICAVIIINNDDEYLNLRNFPLYLFLEAEKPQAFT